MQQESILLAVSAAGTGSTGVAEGTGGASRLIAGSGGRKASGGMIGGEEEDDSGSPLNPESKKF